LQSAKDTVDIRRRNSCFEKYGNDGREKRERQGVGGSNKRKARNRENFLQINHLLKVNLNVVFIPLFLASLSQPQIKCITTSFLCNVPLKCLENNIARQRKTFLYSKSVNCVLAKKAVENSFHVENIHDELHFNY
jgi:hypothetical protein